LQGDFEVGETYYPWEVASRSRKSQQYDRRALLRIPIPCHHMDRCHKTTHQNNSNLTPDIRNKLGVGGPGILGRVRRITTWRWHSLMWNWNLRLRPLNYELAVALIGNGIEIW